MFDLREREPEGDGDVGGVALLDPESAGHLPLSGREAFALADLHGQAPERGDQAGADLVAALAGRTGEVALALLEHEVVVEQAPGVWWQCSERLGEALGVRGGVVGRADVIAGSRGLANTAHQEGCTAELAGAGSSEAGEGGAQVRGKPAQGRVEGLRDPAILFDEEIMNNIEPIAEWNDVPGPHESRQYAQQQRAIRAIGAGQVERSVMGHVHEGDRRVIGAR